jgi:eukaryotic translation initiation factor 2C
LPSPTIKYRDTLAKETSVVLRFGTWNIVNVKFYTGSNLGPWTYIWFRLSRATRDNFRGADIRLTVINFREFLNRSGINTNRFIGNIPPPKSTLLTARRAGTIV